MREKEDLRIKKTKTKLYNSFIFLLKNHSYENITVNDLCADAGVRRATFYKHFSDKNSFLAYAVRYLRERFDEKIFNVKERGYVTEYYSAYGRQVVDFFEEHWALVENVLYSPAAGDIFNVIVLENTIATTERLLKSEELGIVLPSSPEVVASMLIGGASSVLIGWFKDKSTKSIANIKKELSSCVSAVFN